MCASPRSTLPSRKCRCRGRGRQLHRQSSEAMNQSEIDSIRALLGAKPRPVGWGERRARLDEIGTLWPVADDVKLAPVDLDGIPGEWSIVPDSDLSRVLIYLHGGGYCSGSILSHQRLVTEAGR